MKATECRAPSNELASINCCVCNKSIQGPYGRWSEADDGRGGTCSKACELVMEKRHKEKFHVHPMSEV